MIIKPRSRIIQDLDAKSFTVLGSPCSDGLGAGALQTFHAGLAGAEGDFIVVLGDIAPLGRDPYYWQVAAFVNTVSLKPVYVARGNHDGPDYPEYFGFTDFAVLSEDYLLLVLDNSSRRFSDESLEFMRETMALLNSDNVLIAFHVPPPNRFSGHSMTRKEWQRFEDAVGVWRNRISLLLGSHAHNGFEDEVDGLRLVVTGGGGSVMHQADRLARQGHHALEISLKDGHKPTVSMRSLEHPGQRPEPGAEEDGSEPDSPRAVYDECCRRRAELVFRAEAAEVAGTYNLARLFRAGSAACLVQARSLYGLPEGSGVLSVLTMEKVESSRGSFELLMERAERVGAGGDIGAVKFFVCRSCGLVTAGNVGATYCAECGAPGYFLEEVE